MIRVSQGGEYDGETYITCTGGPCSENPQGGVLFAGQSLAELKAFIAEHEGHEAQPR